MLDTPLSVLPAAEPTLMQPIPDSMSADVKCLLQKCPSVLHTGDVLPTPSQGVEHHIHTGSHPPGFAKARCLNPEKLEIAKAEFKHLESAGIVRHSKSPWAFPLHMASKKMDHEGLAVIRPSQLDYNPFQASPAKDATPFKWLA
jgi:hypothetical protein